MRPEHRQIVNQDVRIERTAPLPFGADHSLIGESAALTVSTTFGPLRIPCQENKCGVARSLKNRSDTVGQPPGTEIDVLKMRSLKAKKLGKLPQEKVLLEL